MSGSVTSLIRPRRASCSSATAVRCSSPDSDAASGVDALTLTGHKLGGPYGAGALVVARDLAPVALLHGGGQERDVRSGTLDVPALASFAAAVELAVKHQVEHADRVSALRDDLVRLSRRLWQETSSLVVATA